LPAHNAPQPCAVQRPSAVEHIGQLPPHSASASHNVEQYDAVQQNADPQPPVTRHSGHAAPHTEGVVVLGLVREKQGDEHPPLHLLDSQERQVPMQWIESSQYALHSRDDWHTPLVHSVQNPVWSQSVFTVHISPQPKPGEHIEVDELQRVHCTGDPDGRTPPQFALLKHALPQTGSL